MSAVPLGTVPILDRFDYRHEGVPGWMVEEPSGDTSATFWVRFKDGRPSTRSPRLSSWIPIPR